MPSLLVISVWLRHDVLIEVPRQVDVVTASTSSPETEIFGAVGRKSLRN